MGTQPFRPGEFVATIEHKAQQVKHIGTVFRVIDDMQLEIYARDPHNDACITNTGEVIKWRGRVNSTGAMLTQLKVTSAP